MKKVFLNKILLLILLCGLFIGCTEPYALQTNTFEEAIVVEATITNELKNQEIKLSRTYILEQNGPTFETGATVLVTDNMGNEYNFNENNGKYISETPFQAAPNVEYQLHITTRDGKSYVSRNQQLTTVNPMESVTPRVINKDGVEGVQIIVNSFDPANTSKYYRYEYEETSKVTAPKWSPFKAILLPYPRVCETPEFGGFDSIGLELKTGDAFNSEVCYTTRNSVDIMLTSTNNLTEDRVLDFPIRFISNKDYTIAERYTIQIKQYIQTLESYTYYKTLKEITEAGGSLLSHNQPGFLYGNIKSVTNSNEKVVGFFDVASVSSKRIFFNFDDIFPGEDLPDFFDPCKDDPYDSEDFGVRDPRPHAEFPCGNGGRGNTLRYKIKYNLELYHYNVGTAYYMVRPMCGDCRLLGSNIKPSFWID
ncbi:DUF4249 domain-containing protein [Flavobacterium sp.]|uniref:DUF4249 domain-containing protein n=1 Tax=Flavobacterium sp. TaxID=239 RepID=UPI00261238D7|nr:DUF4249 domain-containing protein [Flavobacterium sp.]